MMAPRSFKIGVAGCAILLATACSQPPVSADAAPGAQPANPTTAGALFAKGCLATLPDFAGTPAALASQPVTQRQASGVYYHNTENLSLKVVRTTAGAYCSVVFGTPLGESKAIAAFGAAARAIAPTTTADVEITVTPAPGGLTYYNARTNAQ